jgi:hypothetical protein
MPLWLDNASRALEPAGYDFFIDTDEDDFRERVERKLGVIAPAMHGTGKVWDYRPALGLLYSEELHGYDFWGHVDFDVVFGRVDQWVTDEFLGEIDMHSNCSSYVNGCWSLYRNTPLMAELFLEEPLWGEFLTTEKPNGWAEQEFSRLITYAEQEGRLRKEWTEWQVFEPSDLAVLRFDGERLMCGPDEVMMAHFRRTKVYPPGCLV